MKKITKILNNKNQLLSFGVFAFSFVIYLLTASRTVNFWDCGELIACSDTLQISHSPGAPFYLLLARLFAMFAFDPSQTAFAVNLLSAVASSFAVYFTYHSIQIISLRILNSQDLKTQLSNKNKMLNLSYLAAVTGSLALAFSSSFWTSAIEAEVYSVSVLFTSLSVWLMLKFSIAETKDKNRWLILSALIIGISTGVHLLNILVIPALVFVYYFDQKKFTYKSFFITLLVSVALLGAVQLCISGIPVIASWFELLFVNSFKAGYNSGLYVFAFLFIALLVLGIYFSGKYKKPIANLIITGFAVFISGYSTYSIIMIRSAANPPIDQNNPETIFNFISYLNREQYGNRPLWYGQQYNSRPETTDPYVDGAPVYDTVNESYEIVSYVPEPNYLSSDKTILPRMWSNQPQDIAAYREWTSYKKDEIPPFSKNLKFMFRYQFSHMYLRYFMWNFAGKQNDFQSFGGPANGNWISEIGFLDNLRLKHLNELPPYFKNNKAHNAYYLIPLILGIIGIVIQFKHDRKYLFVICILFIFTGLAIAFYLNQNPYQARERDYSFLGSFYAFSLWIGLGTIGLYSILARFIKNKFLVYGSSAFCILLVPMQFLVKNYDDHSNRKNDFALHFAKNMLMTCEPNSILFVSGDNETFPLWYLQEAENFRTDVTIVNLSYLNKDWNIDQISRPILNAKAVKLSIAKPFYISGQRDLLPVKENTSRFIQDMYDANQTEIKEDYLTVFNNFIELLVSSGYAEVHRKEFDTFNEYYRNIEPQGANSDFREFCSFVFSLENPDKCSLYALDYNEAIDIINLLRSFINKQYKYPVPLNSALDFVFSNDTSTRIKTVYYDYPIDYFPTRNLCLPIDKKQVLKSFGHVQLREDILVDKMIWQITPENINKSDLMLLEIIRANNWERPIYFSSMLNRRNFLGLEKYLYLEGLAFRLIPVETEVSASDPINVNSVTLYENLIRKFTWGKLTDENVYYDDQSRKIIINLRNHYSRLSRGLYYAGMAKESEEVLNECINLIPDEIIPYEYNSVAIVHGYYRINKMQKAGEISIITANNSLTMLEYYNKLSSLNLNSFELYKQAEVKTIKELYLMAEQYKNDKVMQQLKQIYDKAITTEQKEISGD